MERMNEVRMIGNVGKLDAKEKSTYISLALNESYKKKDDTEWTQNTVWVDVIMFSPHREKVAKNGIKVGDSVLVMGKLSTREYEGKRYLQVLGQKVQVVERKPSGDSNGSAPPDSNGIPNSNESKGDDLPF